MEFEEIPGIGSKTADALAELDDPERALRSGDVATLANAPGISDGRAARIARAVAQAEHDDPGGFLATDRARELHRDVLEIVQERTVTAYGEKRLETFHPSSVQSRIDELRASVERALEREPDPAITDALTGVKPLASPQDVTVRDRCLATADAERYSEARNAVPEMSVEIVDDARDLAELGRGYSTVVALDEQFTGIDVDGDVQVKPNALSEPAEIIPERTLSFFATNRDRLRAAVGVHREAGLETQADLDAIETALAKLNADGTVAGDDELERLASAVDDLDAAASTAESVANDHLREVIREEDVTIEGSDLLSLVEQGAGIDSLLSRELADEHAEAVEAARDHLVDALDLDTGEAEIARVAFTDEPTFPVERDEEAVSRLRDDLTAAKARRETEQKRELAATLADEREAAEQLVRSALELDVELAIARFARDFECTMPTVVEPEKPVGFEIDGGCSPLLDVPFGDVEPVDYGVGGVALLSGVNSGGKTSTLDLVAVVTILAHMGFPVPAEGVTIERFEELHYHAKTQGTLDAGAFESTLRNFGELVHGSTHRLVLVDELESITEPGASAKIIAGILEELEDSEVVGVFVSHLADEIRDVATYDVAVDGIEAVGLVDGELEVNRSPVKGHLARSTPELIVEKLARDEGEAERSGKQSGESTADKRQFYERLLEKFE